MSPEFQLIPPNHAKVRILSGYLSTGATNKISGPVDQLNLNSK